MSGPASTVLRSRARRARRRAVVRLVALATVGSLLATGCAHRSESGQEPPAEPEPPAIVVDADSFLAYEGDARRLREVFVLEVRAPLVVRRIDGRMVERGAAFYHLLPGEHSLDVDYFVGEVDRAGRVGFDEDVVRWRLVRSRLTMSARAGEGGKLEAEARGRALTMRVRRGKTALVETSILIY